MTPTTRAGWAQTFLGWFNAEGSTRSAAIIRIGFVFLLWTSLTFQTSIFKWLHLPLLTACCLVLSVSSVTLMVGFFSRLSAALLAISTVTICWWFGGMEAMRPFKNTTGVWQVAVLIAFLPLGGSFSIDRWLAVRRARTRGQPAPAERAPIWGFMLIRLQLSAIYCYAAFDKIDAEWLAGERMERLLVHYYGYAEVLRDMPWLHIVCVAMAWFATVVEFSLGVLIWVRPLRRYILPLGVILHFGFFVGLALWPLGHRMILLYLAFIDPDAVHRWIDSILDRLPASPRSPSAPQQTS